MASGGKTVSKTYSAPKGAPAYLKTALGDLGTREAIGNKSNPVVQGYFRATDPDGKMFGKIPNTRTVAWCAIYINHVLKRGGISGTGSAMARSFLRWGDTVCNLDGKGKVTDGAWHDIKPGDIVVNWRGASNDGVTGHVYIATRVGDTWVEGIGGNQGDSVTIQRFAKRKVLGARRPRSVMAKESVVATGAGGLAGAVGKVVETVVPDASTVDRIADAAEASKAPLTDLATFKPWVTGLLAIISIALIAYGLYRATRNVQQRS